jgi:hypothetical protein
MHYGCKITNYANDSVLHFHVCVSLRFDEFHFQSTNKRGDYDYFVTVITEDASGRIDCCARRYVRSIHHDSALAHVQFTVMHRLSAMTGFVWIIFQQRRCRHHSGRNGFDALAIVWKHLCNYIIETAAVFSRS